MSGILDEALRAAIGRREALLARLEAEGTDCYRLLHGAVEGAPGVTVDRYGPVLLVQTWGDPPEPGLVEALGAAAGSALGTALSPVWNDRAADADRRGRRSRPPADPRLAAPVGRELGLAYDVRPRHRGEDPLLFLDLRGGRRRLLEASRGASVLNLFAYTCAAGVAAARGGATEVWNVDFAGSALAVGRRNAALNDLPPELFRTVHEDVFPVVRQLAGLPVKGRGARHRPYLFLEPRAFDIVVLDPPRWAKGPFGAVDVVRDYPGVFKPALLATRPGGHVLATNHVPSVALEDWLGVLERAAEKAGRPLASVEFLPPEDDFPSPDGRPPLKVAWIAVG